MWSPRVRAGQRPQLCVGHTNRKAKKRASRTHTPLVDSPAHTPCTPLDSVLGQTRSADCAIGARPAEGGPHDAASCLCSFGPGGRAESRGMLHMLRTITELATLAAQCPYHSLDRRGKRAAMRKDKILIEGIVEEFRHILLPNHIAPLLPVAHQLPSSYPGHSARSGNSAEHLGSHQHLGYIRFRRPNASHWRGCATLLC